MEIDLNKELERALAERKVYRFTDGEKGLVPPHQLQWRLLNLEIAVLSATIASPEDQHRGSRSPDDSALPA